MKLKRSRAPRRLLSVGALTAVVAGASLVVPTGAARATNPPGLGASQTLSFTLAGTNGVGTIVNPGLSCAQGGQGNYRHEFIDSTIPGGVLSSLAGTARANLEVNHDGVEPAVGPVTPAPPRPAAFLLGNLSRLTLANQRGTVQLQLSSGTCAAPTLSFDGTTVATRPDTSGTWVVDTTSASNTGSYRQASGSGTFTLTNVGVGPGATSPYQIAVTGSVAVLQPSLSAAVVTTYWGNLGLDYAARNVSVTYQVTNSGPGDAFGVTLTQTASSTQGVAPLGPTPQALGDIAAGQTATFTVAYHLALLGPCALVILGCQFDTSVTASMPDALDVAASHSAAAHVVAPNLPPPL